MKLVSNQVVSASRRMMRGEAGQRAIGGSIGCDKYLSGSDEVLRYFKHHLSSSQVILDHEPPLFPSLPWRRRKRRSLHSIRLLDPRSGEEHLRENWFSPYANEQSSRNDKRRTVEERKRDFERKPLRRVAVSRIGPLQPTFPCPPPPSPTLNSGEKSNSITKIDLERWSSRRSADVATLGLYVVCARSMSSSLNSRGGGASTIWCYGVNGKDCSMPIADNPLLKTSLHSL